MAANSFKVNHSLNLTPQTSIQVNPDTGDLVFDTTRGFQYFRSSYWSDIESASALTATLSMTSANFTASVVQSSIVRLNGTGIASTISGLTASFHGKRVYIFNNTDQTIIIANDSATEATLANRILAPNASDLNVPPTAAIQLYYDASSLRWIVISQPGSGGSGLKNYLPKGNAESGLNGQNYNDGAVTQPVDGIGGVFNGNFVISNVSPLADKNSFVYTPGSTFGQGHSFDFTIDREDLGQNLMIRMSYESTGTYADGDLAWFVYDVVNNNIIQPYNNQIINASGAQKTISIFKTRTNSTQYRLCLHQVTANTAYTMKFEVAINPQDLTFIPNIQSPQAAGFMSEYAGTTDPKGYMICDGRTISRAAYADLFAIVGTSFGSGDGSTTFNIPDMRGRFARGLDGTAGRDPDSASRTAMNTGGNTGNNIGSVQVDIFASHTHIQNPHTHTDSGHTHPTSYWSPAGGTNSLGAGGALSTQTATGTGNANITSTTATNQNTGGNETRPKNANLNFIIKLYNDQYIPVSTTALPYQQEVGFIQASGSNTVGQDFLYCDGSSYQTSSYPELFAKIGYNFGGIRFIFNVPDLRGRSMRGLDDAGTYSGSGTAVSNVLTFTGHKFTTARKVRFTNIGSLSGVAINTTYYAIRLSANTLSIASTRANALAGTAIAVTGTNTATLTSWEDADKGTRVAGLVGGSTTGIGSFQDEAVGSHTHTITRPGAWGDTQGGIAGGKWARDNGDTANYTNTTDAAIGNGGGDTRPSNIAVKYYIRAIPNAIPAYEQSTNQGVDLVLSSPIINWQAADTFFMSASADTTFSFMNQSNGKTLVLTVNNTSGSNINVTLPIGLKVPAGFITIVKPSMYNVYTFFMTNNTIMATVVADMI